jgi:hypothetical protein
MNVLRAARDAAAVVTSVGAVGGFAALGRSLNVLSSAFTTRRGGGR